MPKIPSGMRKTARGSYESRFTVNGKRYSVYGKSVKECREKESVRRQEIKDGTYKTGRELSMDDYFQMWENGRIGTVKENTIRTERYIYRCVSNVCIDSAGTKLGGIKLRKLDRELLRRAQAALRSSYSVSTVNRSMSVIKAMLESATEERYLSWNPSKGLRLLKDLEKPPRDTIHRALTRSETEAFFRKAAEFDSWYYPFYSFLLNTGCRFGEAGALMVRDIRSDSIWIGRTLTRTIDGHLIIGSDAKTGHSVRLIPVRPEAAEAVSRQQAQNRQRFSDGEDPSLPIFRAPKGGLLGARNVGKDIDRICSAAGIERFTAHAFRDTFATRAVESGMQAKTLQEILGHADIGITMNLYAHVMEDTKRSQMAAVELMEKKAPAD